MPDPQLPLGGGLPPAPRPRRRPPDEDGTGGRGLGGRLGGALRRLEPGLRRLRPAAAYVLRRLPLLLFPAVLVFLMESLSRSSITDTYGWAFSFVNETRLNYWLALAVFLLAAAVLGLTRPAYASVFAAFGAIAFASGMKTNQTGSPLFLWDLVMKNEMKDAAAAFNPALTRPLLAEAAGAAVVLAALLAFVKPLRLRLAWPERAAFAVLALVLFASVAADVPIPLQANAHIFTVGWDQQQNYARNGYLLATVMNAHLMRVPKPPGVGSADIRALVRGIEQAPAGAARGTAAAGGGGAGAGAAAPSPGAGAGGAGSAAAGAGSAAAGASAPAAGSARRLPGLAAGQAPNVIVVLSESFWDPTLIKSASFSEDPIPNFHRLMRDYTSGWLLSPQFGGTTANVEFEVLTGNSVRFLPDDSIAYIQYMNHGVDSLASILTRQGYTATAFNPFFNWFFDSRNVYKNLGFSRFVSSEFFDPNYHGPYLADRQVMQRVMQMTDSTAGPDFIFANTMENHGPYPDKFGYNPIKVSGPFSTKSVNILENYATGVQAFDQAFQELVDHYAASSEPTVILCFGDHLPSLGDNYFAYQDTKYLNGGTADPDFVTKIHETPFVLWSNYDTGPRETLRLSPSFLSPYLLQAAGRPGTYYTDYLSRLSQRIPVIPPRDSYAKMNVDPNQLLDYQRLQYDILFGGRYGYKETGVQSRIVNPGFALGYGKPHISRAAVQENDGLLEVDGDYFTSECKVWLDGAKLDTIWYSDHKLTARLPKDRPAGPAGSVQVKLVDYQKKVIAESEPVVMGTLGQRNK